jgi:hypothetical protein
LPRSAQRGRGFFALRPARRAPVTVDWHTNCYPPQDWCETRVQPGIASSVGTMNYIALILGRATSVAILVQLCVLLLLAVLFAATILAL